MLCTQTAATRASDELADLKKRMEDEKARAYDAQKANDAATQQLRNEVATLSQDSQRLKETRDSLAASESKVATLTADLANGIIGQSLGRARDAPGRSQDVAGRTGRQDRGGCRCKEGDKGRTIQCREAEGTITVCQ